MAVRRRNGTTRIQRVQQFLGVPTPLTGITAIIKMWLDHGCDLSPDELFGILKDEYRGKA